MTLSWWKNYSTVLFSSTLYHWKFHQGVVSVHRLAVGKCCDTVAERSNIVIKLLLIRRCSKPHALWYSD